LKFENHQILNLKFGKLPSFQKFKCQIWKITKFQIWEIAKFSNFESEKSLNFKFEKLLNFEIFKFQISN
jgi:hypothetical protein